MAIEVEARFAAAGPEPLRALATRERLGPAGLGPVRSSDEVDAYLDTAGGSLAAHRWACRLRSRDGRVIVSLKGPPDAEAGGWLHRRAEVEGPATAARDPLAWPQSPARELVDRLRDGAPLVERFVLRQVRVERDVILDERRIGTLSLDTVVVEHRGQPCGCFHVVELELAADAGGEGRALAVLAAELEDIRGLAAEPRSKLEHALGLIDAP